MRARGWLLALLVAVPACSRCASPEGVASIAQMQGLVEVDDAAPAIAWGLATNGQELSLGEAIRTGTRATAQLALTGGGQLRVRERSIVRFSPQPTKKDGFRVGVELGEAEVESGASPISFDTMFGAATIERGARVRLQGREEGGLQFQVVVGSATVESRGQSTRIAQGQTFVVDVGGAIIEQTVRVPDASVPPPPPPPPPPAASPVMADAAVAQGLLASVQGAGTRVRASDDADWRTLSSGETRLPEGTRVSVAQGSTVEVRGARGTALVRGAAEFTVGGDSGALVNTTSGTVIVTSQDEMRVQVPGGSIVVRGTTELDVARDGTRVDVRSGRANVDARDGNVALSTGDGTTLRRDGTMPSEERAPARARFALDGGENATIHDAAAPTPVRVRFSTCPAEGVVELARNGSFARPIVSRGSGGANILVPLGAQRYRVRCVRGESVDADPVASGTLRVVRDAGAQSPPRNAPKTTVETDGRRYTVLYQTMLPEITVMWPRAPSSSGYQLTLTGPGGRNQNVRAATPSTVFPSGRLDEGTYTLTWQTADGASRSRSTTLLIEFDDDTPVAYLRSPAPSTALTGTVHVEGIAQEGASASANGHALPMDARARFRGDVPAPAQGECLAVRVAHPERGLHYYLRCGGQSQ